MSTSNMVAENKMETDKTSLPTFDAKNVVTWSKKMKIYLIVMVLFHGHRERCLKGAVNIGNRRRGAFRVVHPSLIFYLSTSEIATPSDEPIRITRMGVHLYSDYIPLEFFTEQSMLIL